VVDLFILVEGVGQLARVDGRLPSVAGKVGVVHRDPLPEVAVRGQEEDRVKLDSDLQCSPDADAEDAGSDEADKGLDGPVLDQFRDLAHEDPSKVLLRPDRGRPLSVHETGDEAVALLLDPDLVDGHPGDKPRGLQDEDGGDGDGAADAECLKTGKDL
jgi:hypothetical protein